ncbi:MAG: response regulator [Spirochaetales bacterium]|nr:response regulator [Spirochaetales bacterium]
MSDSKATILIVDDEQEARDMFAKFLNRHGFEVQTASQALEAIRKLKSRAVDLVLTDYHMPEVNGLELLEEIRNMDAHLPVIMMSGVADMHTALKAIKSHAFDFLTKPVDSSELLNTIRLALEHNRQHPATAPETVDRGFGPVLMHIDPAQTDQYILHINRALDQHQRGTIDNALRQLEAEGHLGRKLIVSLHNVPYINSTGLNYLLDLLQSWKTRGFKVVLTELSEPVYRYFKPLGYLDYLPYRPTLEEARAHLREF